MFSLPQHGLLSEVTGTIRERLRQSVTKVFLQTVNKSIVGLSIVDQSTIQPVSNLV